MWFWISKNLGKIAMVGLVIAAVGIGIWAGAPSVLEIVGKVSPDIAIDTIEILGTGLGIGGGVLALISGSGKIFYDQGARDVFSAQARGALHAQAVAMQQDGNTVDEALKTKGNLEKNEALQAQVNSLNVQIGILEKKNRENDRQINSQIDVFSTQARGALHAQAVAMQQDGNTVDEALKTKGNLEKNEALQAQVNSLNAQIGILEKKNGENDRQINSQIMAQTKRDEEIEDRLTNVEKKIESQNKSSPSSLAAQNGQRFFAKGAKLNSRRHRAVNDDGEEQRVEANQDHGGIKH